ncbi:hypothetical protein ACGYLO_16390 [Sulfitobacter sp. 1A13353]|uniref:hypothetical protein n=1 Tax=Sulfitobacter sp. 1A13353 TaxID=3368568 RepID=UPI00374684B7
MNKPLRRTPMRRKSKKRAAREASPEGREDAEYLRKVRALPCCICTNFGMIQTSPTDAHHTKSGRHGKERTPDRQAIPLCKCHHQGLRFDRDKSKHAFHQGQATWEALYGPDTDYIAATQDAIERMDL